jgi:hypothetical protein
VTIVVLLGLSYVLGPLFARRRPEWTKPFVIESPSDLPELPKTKRNRFSAWVIALVALSVVASAALVVELMPHPSSLSVILLLAGWVRSDSSTSLI